MKQGVLTTFFKNNSSQKLEFAFKKGQEIHPNDEQKKIIYEDKKSHMQIKACAGSGKTTTILCRVKYLIEIEKVKPERILITAFNIDAAKNVKQKLAQLISEKVEKQITVNNIDKLSKQWLTQANKFEVSSLSVREFTTKVVQLMNSDPSFRQKMTSKFDYIFFDEFQDINPDEYELLKIFAKQNTIITIIGDDAQNIYGFRESKEINSQTIHIDFVGIKLLFLSTNYRSTDQIVKFANQVISNSKLEYGYKIQMVSHPPNNQGKIKQPDFTKFMSISEQNEAIISHIKELIDNGYTHDQIAILSRTNKPLQFLEEALEIYNNQSQKLSKIKANILNLEENEKNFKNTKQQQDNSGHNIIPFIAHISNNKEKSAKIKFKTPSNISQQRVTLTTIHKSKGLEWDVVFLIGLNDDYFPGTNNEKEVEEERRVFYVGITRAKKQLLLSFVWSRSNQNMTRFVAEINQKLFTGFSQPIQNDQQKCNEKMRQIDKIKSKTILLGEIIEFLTKEHYEQLRTLGCLDFKKDIIQIHFKCNLGQYVLENNLVQEFATFFKCYIIRCIGEEYTSIQNESNCKKGLNSNQVSNDGYENDSMAMAFNNKYCSGVLFSEQSLINIEHKTITTLNFGMDQGMLDTKYIQEQQKREEFLKSLITFKDRKQNSDNILKQIYNVSMCQSIYNQRRRLLHKEDAFKHFEMNKNILKNGKKQFIPEVLRKTPKLDQVPQVNQTIYDESFQMKTEYDIITEDTIFEIKFEQIQLLKPEDSIELLAKVAILQNDWKSTKIKYICIYYPLQGELTTIDISNKDSKLQDLLKILYQARQQKQEACQANCKSITSSQRDSQIQQSQTINSQNQEVIQRSIQNQNKGPDFICTHSQKQIISQKIKQVNKNDQTQYDQYNDDDLYGNLDQLYEINNINSQTRDQSKIQIINKMQIKQTQSTQSQSQSTYQKNIFRQDIQKSNSIESIHTSNYQHITQRQSSIDENQNGQSNCGFIKASDMKSSKSTFQTNKPLSSQQKCYQGQIFTNKINSQKN